jgi:hypothetical protein
MSLQTDLAAAVALTQGNAAKVDQFVNGPAAGDDSLIDTEAGPVKTLARITAEAAAAAGAGVVPFSPPVAWATGLNCVVGPPATAVTFAGESYYCNTPHVAGATFAADAAKWTKFAAKGADATAPVTTKGDQVGHDGTAATRIPVGADGSVLMARSAATLGSQYVSPFTGTIFGLTYQNNGTDPTNDIDVAAGGCMSDDGTEWIAIAATTKQLDVVWAPDNGATPSGMLGPAAAIGNHDYLMYAIKNPTSGATAVIAEKADTALVLPTGYTKKRAIGFIQRTAGAIAAFTTYETAGGGLELWWATPVIDFFHANTLTTTRRTDAIRVPKVFSVLAHVTVQTYDATTGTNVRITRVGETDIAVTTDASNGGSANMGHYPGVLVAMAHISLRTSSDGKIAARAQSTVVDQYNCVTNGFTWSRR